MDGIRIEVTGNIARIVERPARITAGTVGLPVEFSFDNQWEGLSKTAVFKAGCVEMIVENVETQAAIPWEITEKPNVWLSIGVYGVNADGTVAITTIWANICVICDGANPDGAVSKAPTPPVWQRLWNAIGNLTGLATNAKGNLVEAINEVNNIALAGGIESDPTLSQSGKAADAKATGDAINGIIGKEASGSIITVDDSGHAPLQGLKIYGKTTQNGTPTPEAPIPLVSAGESGAISVTVAGKNLFGGDALADKLVEVASATKDETAGTVTFDSVRISGKVVLENCFKENTQYTFIFYGRNAGTDSRALNLCFKYTDGTVVGNQYFKEANKFSCYVYTSAAGKTLKSLSGSEHYSSTVLEYNKCGVFEGVLTEADFEPYKGQTLTVSTPNGLHSVGDIHDEIDFARGVRVQRIGEVVYTGNESINADSVQGTILTVVTNDVRTDRIVGHVACTHFEAATVTGYINRYGGVAVRTGGVGLAFGLDIGTTASEVPSADRVPMFKAFLKEQYDAGTPVTVKYVLAQPIETPLTAEELAAYAALHTNKPNTTVFNDGDAEMEIRYCTPNTAVPMNVGSGASGKVLAVDEHGCVVPTSIFDFGYLGEYETDDEWKAIIENCIQQMPGDTTAHASLMWHGRWSVTIHKHGDSNNFVTVIEDTYWNPISYTYSSYARRVRSLCANTWGEWEWENPPMIVGNEYRTTERWNGHAVYTTIIDCGTPPSKSTKSVTMPSYAAPTRIIGWSGYVGHWGVSLPATASGWDVFVTSDYIAIATDSDRSSDSTDNKVYITIKYTKD